MNGIMDGIPGRYAGAISVMEAMHWSWEDFCQAPEDLTDEILTRLAADGKWREQKAKLDEQKRNAQQAQLRARHGR